MRSEIFGKENVKSGNMQFWQIHCYLVILPNSAGLPTLFILQL